MKDITSIPIESTFLDTRDKEAELLDACFQATIILIDLCNSTKIKQEITFPKWIFIMQDFFNTITKYFEKRKVFPIKYLGDAVLYMIPYHKDEKAQKYMEINGKEIPRLKLKEILDLCINIRDEWWKKNEKYIKHEESFKNFLSITLAIDHGLVIDFNQLNESISNDPLGTPVDRCFRISKYAGKNHIVCSEDFINALKSESKIQRDYCDDCFIKLKICPPKGFDELNTVFVHDPSEGEKKWILSYEYEKIITDSDKPLNQKMQTHLLLKEVNKLKDGKL